ncbi:unnamed protein product [Rotaria sp. Silwood2]|nr:unnamed protein product [Rotaria sp. Silwood2]CAF3911362.1 unnamed protein product [Rotaria sp. Silwood2]CAF3911413.1 unnamed protein product [Rotaria sp. Silwood2]
MTLSFHRSTINNSDGTLSIRIYHNGDFPYEHVRSVLGPLFENYYGAEGLRSMVEMIDHIWCAYDIFTDQCIACALVQYEPGRETLYIKLFGVRRINQGQGVGSRLLDAILSWAKRQRYLAVLLHTQVNNYKAISLYKKMGFRKQLYLPNFFHSQTPTWSLLSGEPDGFLMTAHLN